MRKGRERGERSGVMENSLFRNSLRTVYSRADRHVLTADTVCVVACRKTSGSKAEPATQTDSGKLEHSHSPVKLMLSLSPSIQRLLPACQA